MAYCRDEPALDDNNAITDFNATNATTNSFKIKEKNNFWNAFKLIVRLILI